LTIVLSSSGASADDQDAGELEQGRVQFLRHESS
jgi:hypothetical protein